MTLKLNFKGRLNFRATKIAKKTGFLNRYGIYLTSWTRKIIIRGFTWILLRRKSNVCIFILLVVTYLLILNESCKHKTCSELKTTPYDFKISHMFSLINEKSAKEKSQFKAYFRVLESSDRFAKIEVWEVFFPP